MRPFGVYLVLCGYIVGLLVAPYLVWPWGLLWLLGGWLLGAIVPRLWRRSPRSLTWVCIGIAGFLSGIYLQIRQPIPAETDISNTIAAIPKYTEVQVWGTLEERPQLTRAGKARFRLAVEQLTWIDDRPGQATSAEQTQTVSGTVYTTLPLLQATGLGYGDRVEISGRLYQPSTPTNPGQFDFRRFLAQQGIWAGLVGESIDWETMEDHTSWLETVRSRIVRAHVEGLGVPSGLLMSVMAIGRWGVDLPYELRDRLTDLGLAHALAASGFQVGIVLNSVLKWAGGSARLQFGIGSITLVLYTALAGFQPSVCRAAFMGWAGVLGGVVRRRVRSSGTLLAIATLLLLWEPLLIQNLGFQLSFLATFGLIVSTEPIARLFGVFPVWLADSLAVPIAATLWTLPLQIYIFNVVSPIAIPVNLAVGELLGVMTTVGFFSGMAAVVSPAAGSFLARGLAYPIDWMISGLIWVHDHLGRVWFVQQIEGWQMVALYAVLFSLWLWRSRCATELEQEALGFNSVDVNPSEQNTPTQQATHSRKNQPKSQPASRSAALVGSTIAGCALCLAIIILPGWWQTRDRVQVYVLDEASEPVVMVRDRAETVLIGNGVEPETTTFSLLPMLRSLGINQLSLAIDPTPPDTGANDPTWQMIADHVPISEQMDGAAVQAAAATAAAIEREAIAVIPLDAGGNLALRLGDRSWLVLRDESEAAIGAVRERLATLGITPQVVCWSGGAIEDVASWPLVGAIAVDRLDPLMASTLAIRGVEVWETRQGAVVVKDATGSGTIRRAIGADQRSTEWSL